MIGDAVDFNGDADGIDVGDDTSLSITGKLTLSAWAHGAGDGNPIEKLYNSYQLTVGSTGYFSFYYDNQLGTQKNAGSAAPALTTDEWHYYVITADPSGSVKLYADGKSKGSASFDGTAFDSVPDNNVGIGARAGGGSGRYNGIIDEARITAEVRNQDCIKTEYNNRQII